MRLAHLLAFLAISALATMSPLAGEEGEKKVPSIEIEAITVEPSKPSRDTLCKLSLKLHNHGSESASRFAFEVRINGKSLPVYEDQMILLAIAAGESTELPLHNFWSSETHRPFPKDGKLTIEVTLLEATWIRVEEKDGVEERTPLGKVDGLPANRQVILKGTTVGSASE